MTSNQTQNEIISQVKQIAQSSLLAEGVNKLISVFHNDSLFDAISIYINDTSIERREWIICIRILCRIDKVKANQIFVKLLETETNIDKRARLIDHLAYCGLSTVVEPLIKIALEDEDADIRFMAVVALRSIGDQRAIPSLKKLIEEDKGINYEGETIASQAELALKQLSANDY